MTLHVVYTHECPQCEAFYIPYDQAIPCPRCGVVEAERFDYIPQAAASMQYNLEAGGSYTPGAWWVGSLGDHILSILFSLFDAYRQQPQTNFADFARNTLSSMRWGDQAYLEGHIVGIAVRIHQELESATG
jgi:hypothetical protein